MFTPLKQVKCHWSWMYVPNLNFTWTLRNNFSHFQKGPQKKLSRVLDPLNFTWTPRNYFLHFQKGPQKFSWTPRILEPALPLMTNTVPLIHLVRHRQLKFLGHILRMSEEEPARRYALYIPTIGKRRPGRPRTSYLDYVQRLLGDKEGAMQEQ